MELTAPDIAQGVDSMRNQKFGGSPLVGRVSANTQFCDDAIDKKNCDHAKANRQGFMAYRARVRPKRELRRDSWYTADFSKYWCQQSMSHLALVGTALRREISIDCMISLNIEISSIVSVAVFHSDA